MLGLLVGVGLVAPCPGKDVKQNEHSALDGFLQQSGFYKIQLDWGSHHEQLTGNGVFGGEAQKFLVDSGCPITRVNESLAVKLKSLKDLDIEIEDKVLGQIRRPDILLLDKVELNKAVFMNQPALPLDAAMLGQRSDIKIVLGCDFFRRNNCLIDCYSGRLYVRSTAPAPGEQAALENTLREAGYHEIPLDSGSSLTYRCDVVAEGKPLKLIIDSGAEHVGIDDNLAKELKMTMLPTTPIMALDSLGEHVVDIGRIPTVQMGDFTFTNFGVNVIKMDTRKSGEKSVDNVQGMLGMAFLYPSQALIDFNHDRMWIMPVVYTIKIMNPPPVSRPDYDSVIHDFRPAQWGGRPHPPAAYMPRR